MNNGHSASDLFAAMQNSDLHDMKFRRDDDDDGRRQLMQETMSNSSAKIEQQGQDQDVEPCDDSFSFEFVSEKTEEAIGSQGANEQ